MSIIGEKSKIFAAHIIRLYQYLCREKKEFILSKQLLRSATSIGANMAEAECAYGRKDFLAKVYVAFKETAETIYWLDLLYKTDYLTETQYQFCIREANELRKMLSATTKTMKSDSL